MWLYDSFFSAGAWGLDDLHRIFQLDFLRHAMMSMGPPHNNRYLLGIKIFF